MYLGLDIGTSSVKAILVDAAAELVASASAQLEVSRPRPGWSEQDPEAWVQAVFECLDRLKVDCPRMLSEVAGIGLSGQMHGATLLGADDRPLRPCILWNDGRSQQQCLELEQRCPRSREITGNIAMPGFTAPKLLWIREHEPEVFKATRRVLLPKDYVRLALTGEHLSDMSDAAGTLWMDVANRTWSSEMLNACGLDYEAMPTLVEGSDAAGRLAPELAARWGMQVPPPVAGGAGDNAASACGIGATRPGDAFISLGTSGVVFTVTGSFMPNTDGAVHAFCHAIPRTWHQMGVVLSAASCFEWLAAAQHCPVGELYAALDDSRPSGRLLFFPYLSGERTPHNDAALRGAFIGLDHDTDRQALARAVADGVAFAFRDCIQVLEDAGSGVSRLVAVGGGSRSMAWLQILSNVLGVPIDVPRDGDRGAAFGAARLARMLVTGESPESACPAPDILHTLDPQAVERGACDENWARFRAAYPSLKEALSA